MKGFLKYLLLFVVACIGAILIYYATVPENKRIPLSIELNNEQKDA